MEYAYAKRGATSFFIAVLFASLVLYIEGPEIKFKAYGLNVKIQKSTLLISSTIFVLLSAVPYSLFLYREIKNQNSKEKRLVLTKFGIRTTWNKHNIKKIDECNNIIDRIYSEMYSPIDICFAAKFNGLLQITVLEELRRPELSPVYHFEYISGYHKAIGIWKSIAEAKSNDRMKIRFFWGHGFLVTYGFSVANKSRHVFLEEVMLNYKEISVNTLRANEGNIVFIQFIGQFIVPLFVLLLGFGPHIYLQF